MISFAYIFLVYSLYFNLDLSKVLVLTVKISELRKLYFPIFIYSVNFMTDYLWLTSFRHTRVPTLNKDGYIAFSSSFWGLVIPFFLMSAHPTLDRLMVPRTAELCAKCPPLCYMCCSWFTVGSALFSPFVYRLLIRMALLSSCLRCVAGARCGVACVPWHWPNHRHRLGDVAYSDALSGHLFFIGGRV